VISPKDYSTKYKYWSVCILFIHKSLDQNIK
jgi:hypothetical protein